MQSEDDDDDNHTKIINDYATVTTPADNDVSDKESDVDNKQYNNDTKNYWYYFQSEKIQTYE